MSAQPKPKPHTYKAGTAWSHRDWQLDETSLPGANGITPVFYTNPGPNKTMRRPPRRIRTHVRAIFQNARTGERRRATYVHTVDQSRYPADWLKRITKERKGRI